MTWNHERFAEEALRSALAQDWLPLEIIVSDDASTDGTWAIVERIVAGYDGPHRVRLNRNERNLGVGAHTDLVMAMAQGEMVVLAAGDDISESDRVGTIARAWRSSPRNVLCLASHAVGIDEGGHGDQLVTPCSFGSNVDAMKLAHTGEALLGATLAVHRRLLDIFGPIGSEIRTCEDTVLSFRAALAGDIVVVEQPLVRYRRHASSLMGTTAPIAAGNDAFVAGLDRMLRGLLATRRRQLADLEAGGALRADAAKLRVVLTGHLTRAETSVALLEGERGSLRRLLLLVREGLVSKNEAIKTLLMTRTPSLWFRYIVWRHARLRRREAA